ncbi:MAG: hypothetical protein AB1393_03700 [Candidatus Edwardsbacteria bacterium]
MLRRECFIFTIVTMLLANCTLKISIPVKKQPVSIRHTSKILPDSSMVEEFYLKDFLVMVDSSLGQLGTKMQELPFLVIAYNKDKKPIQGAKITIRAPGKEDTIVLTDKDGKANFSLKRDILSLDPVCILEGGAHYNLKMSARISGEGSKVTQIAKTISTEGQEKIEEGKIAVYFPKGQEQKAKEIFDFLKKEESLIKEKLGLEAETPWGVILTNETPPFACVEKGLWPASVEEEIGKICHIDIHEWTEGTLDSKFSLYQNDPSTRWIGDGIATLMQYFFLERFFPEDFGKEKERGLDIIKICIDSGIKTYDLTKWKARVISKGVKTCFEPVTEKEKLGYGMSFYVWMKIIEHSKEGILLQFFAEIQKLKGAKNKDLIKCLTNLSGLNIEKMLKKVNVEEAYNYFKNLNP